MKIFIYGDSNTWGQIPNDRGYSKNAVQKRYKKEEIWWYPISQNNYVVINGLPGRAVCNDSPWFDDRNATKTLDNDIPDERFDLAIVMLGTNDCKSEYGMPANLIADNLFTLIDRIKDKTAAKVLVVSPPQIASGTKVTNKYYVDGTSKSIALDYFYHMMAKEHAYPFVSGLSALVGEDGEHLTKEGHKQLGGQVLIKVDEIKKERDLQKTA